MYDPDPGNWTWTWYTDWDGNPVDMGPDFVGDENYGYWTKPVLSYNTVTYPKAFQLRFLRRDCGYYYTYDWGWQFKNVKMTAGSSTLLSEWAATYKDNWIVSDPRSPYEDPNDRFAQMSKVKLVEETVGDGSGAMWYTGSGTLGTGATTRILELKNAVDVPYWDEWSNESAALEFDSYHWIEGGDTLRVEYSTNDGQSWNKLYGSALPKITQIQDPNPDHWIWHEPWTDPDFGDTYPVGGRSR